jgi:chitodextrinase
MKRATVTVLAATALLATMRSSLPAAAPTTVTDLRVQATHIQAAGLAWTVPSESGGAGLGSYDVRYATSPIDDGNWAAANQAAGEPTPGAPGATEYFTVTGLAPNTLYYFAIKTSDASGPPNWSGLSNVPSGTTLPAIMPVTVHNPWLVNDRVADTRNLSTMAATYVKAYSPSGVVAPASDEDRAINIYNNQKRRLYHWADEPPSVGGDINDPTYNQNVFGWCLCGRHVSNACTIVKAAGLGQRRIGLPGHWIYEVQYDGGYHAYDTMTTMYVYNKAMPRKVASCAEMKADTSLLANAVADNRACPGFLLCGDTVDWYQSAVNSWSDSGDSAVATTWTGDMDIRLGQSFKRTWESWLNQHPPIGGGGTPPYHHEASRDWKDYVNYYYWEPYRLTVAESTAIGISYNPTFRRWANGTDTLAPDFRTAAYQAMLDPTSSGVATYYNDGVTPDLHGATVGVQGEAVFKIDVPFYITDANFSGDFVKTNAGDVCKVYVSVNGTSWTQVYDAPIGTTQVTNQNLRSNVFGRWKNWWIKVQVKGSTAKSDAGVSNLVVTTIFEHNKGAMAYLDKGVNHFSLTFDNPAELAASGNVLRVVYKWKEYSGTDWTIDKQFETHTSASPTAFTINTAGAKVPRTEYILLEVTPPPFDPIPPAGIIDLAGSDVRATKVTLAWTATGDDGGVGSANAYDLRYSTSAITDDTSFNAATQVADMSSPGPAGTGESFTVNGLTANTTYYFAIKAVDEAGNRSALSNVVSAATPPPDVTRPQTILNLAALPGATSSTADLTWTAPADYGYGGAGPYTCTSYDLRYSMAPITEGNFASATSVAGVPAPKAPGAAESFTVTGLQGRTTYYFAIKSTDEAGNVSLVSNCASARTTGQLMLTPIADLGLYGAGSDYSNRGTGGRFDIGLTQDGLLQFDLAGRIEEDEMITGATLQLYTARQGYSFNLHVVGYPLAAAWQEGIGNAGTVGDLGFPWGPVSIGDAVFAYKQTTAVGLGSGSFATVIVATDGIPWNTPGGRGIGSDVVNRGLLDLDWARTVGPTDALGSPMPPIALTPDGVAVVRGWSTGTISNHGMNMWATSGTGYAALTTREYSGMKPQLILNIGLAGDANTDGGIDVADLLKLAATFGKRVGDVGYDAACDFNGEGSVDVSDLLILAWHWPA